MKLLIRQTKDGIKRLWEYFQSTDKQTAIDKAFKLGWAENKVQVRATSTGNVGETLYTIEPYEGCGCRNLLNYKDYIDVRS